jgi:hypothetical protein
MRPCFLNFEKARFCGCNMNAEILMQSPTCGDYACIKYISMCWTVDIYCEIPLSTNYKIVSSKQSCLRMSRAGGGTHARPFYSRQAHPLCYWGEQAGSSRSSTLPLRGVGGILRVIQASIGESMQDPQAHPLRQRGEQTGSSRSSTLPLRRVGRALRPILAATEEAGPSGSFTLPLRWVGRILRHIHSATEVSRQDPRAH